MPWFVEQILAVVTAAVAFRFALAGYELLTLPFRATVRQMRKAARWRRRVFSFGRTAGKKQRHHDYGR